MSADSEGEVKEEEEAPNQNNKWQVSVWSWKLDGPHIYKDNSVATVTLTQSDAPAIDFQTLDYYPLRDAGPKIKALVERRARRFWECKDKKFIEYEYRKDDANRLDFVAERFMIDRETYQLIHPSRSLITHKQELLPNYETFPDDGSLSMCPTTLVGYNMRLKKWMDIEVDRIRDVQWNKSVFNSLAINSKTKNIIRALVSRKIKASVGTDLIQGKGNGLIMLLHGGPGTGKTLTAESVAELVEKPLYRVTCADIGVTPESVEKYLETVLRLGKTWECVVLLDEAEVFLEQRTLTDLNRNALVSVFLRVLEYYDGVLILTSNRVGTFDEAFKSRIQLAIHYDGLEPWQRRKIWRNFFDHIQNFGRDELEYDELLGQLDVFSDYDMNGRQIRNVITTARQIAQFSKKKVGTEFIHDAIEVTTKFDSYIRKVNEDLPDNEIARQYGVR